MRRPINRVRAAAIVLAFPTLVAAGACARQSAVAPAADGAAAEPVDLDIRLARQANDGSTRGTERLRFEGNRPAYVAVFEVVSGRGVSLLYPTNTSEIEHPVARYSGVLGYVRGRSLYGWGVGNAGQAGNRTYRFLIAADEPLKVRAFVESPDSLRAALGPAMFASPDPIAVMDRLTTLVIPNVGEAAWSTDIDLRPPRQSRVANQ